MKTKKDKKHDKTPVTPWADSQNDQIVAPTDVVLDIINTSWSHKLPPRLGFHDESQYAIGTKDEAIIQPIFDMCPENLKLPFPEPEPRSFSDGSVPCEVTIEYMDLPAPPPMKFLGEVSFGARRVILKKCKRHVGPPDIEVMASFNIPMNDEQIKEFLDLMKEFNPEES
jgi:hypothetical protein